MGRAPPGSMGVGVGRKGFPGPALREWPRRQQLGVNGGGGGQRNEQSDFQDDLPMHS